MEQIKPRSTLPRGKKEGGLTVKLFKGHYTSSSGYETESRLTPPPIEEPDIREIFGRLWWHKALIAGIVSVAMLSTTVILTQLTPLYTAETEILIRGSGDTLIQLSTERETPTPEDTETVKSEVEVLRSRDLAVRVIDRLKLTFPVNWLHKLVGSPAFERSRSLSDNPSRKTELFLADLKVYQKGESRVIAVEFRSDNPKQAALIGNTIAELYIGDQLATKSKAIQRANTWLEKSVASLQDRVEASEKAVQDFRKASGLLEISDNTLSDQQLAELDKRLILASAEREAAQVRLNRARQVIQSASGIELAGDILQSPLIQCLREEKMLSEHRLTEFNRRYHAAHPNSEALKTQILDVKASIKAEVEAIIKNLQNEFATANEREVAVQRRLAPSSSKLQKLIINTCA
ncbi:MAG: GumC family protein [Gammaproteobacteria bacterium]